MKPLKCTRCHREIATEALDLDSGRGSCGFCKTGFRFFYQEAPQPTIMHLPDGFKVTRGEQATTISISWFNSRFFTMLILAIILFLGVYVFWTQAASLLVKTILGAGFGFALYTSYYGLAVLLNKTRIQIEPESVVVRVTPIPWPGGLSVKASEIQRLGFEQTRREGTPSRVAYSFVVYAETQNKGKRVLLDGLNRKGAELLESELKRILKPSS